MVNLATIAATISPKLRAVASALLTGVLESPSASAPPQVSHSADAVTVPRPRRFNATVAGAFCFADTRNASPHMTVRIMGAMGAGGNSISERNIARPLAA